jgi:uncharacterized membrane protein YccF (DUF307 family)
MHLILAHLLHVGHASNAVEVALTVLGFVVTLAGLGAAVVSLWTRPRLGAGAEGSGRLERRRRLREDEASLLDEDVDGGA